MNPMKKHHLATITILEIAHDLLKPGRPRKRPGKPRPEAVTPWASDVSYRDGNAVRYSLPGAVQRAAYSIRREVSKATLSRARSQASRLIAIELSGIEGFSLPWLDEKWADTREVQRAIKRSIRQLEARV